MTVAPDNHLSPKMEAWLRGIAAQLPAPSMKARPLQTDGEPEMNETLIPRLRSYLEPDATIVRTGFVPIRQETILEIVEALAEREEAITRAHQHGYRQGIEAGAKVAETAPVCVSAALQPKGFDEARAAIAAAIRALPPPEQPMEGEEG